MAAVNPLAWTAMALPEVAEALISLPPRVVPTLAVPPVKVGVTVMLVAL